MLKKIDISVPQSLRTLSKKRIVVVIGLIVVVAAMIPIPYSYSESASIAHATKTNDDSELELGESKVAQQGADGSKVINYDAYQNAWGYLFGTSPMFTKETSIEIDKAPSDHVVHSGTRKYQYMMCSNGSHRYYTDDQFKERNTGFTSKSPDYCAQNNQGEKTTLSDGPDGGQAPTNQLSQQTQLRNNIPAGASCREENIIKYSTRYEDRSYLEKGTSVVGIPGYNGYTFVCPSLIGTPHEQYAKTVNPPQDEVIYRGTGKTTAEIAAEKAEQARIRAEQDLLTRRNQQNFARNQCVQSLRAQGMSSDRASYECLRMYPAI